MPVCNGLYQIEYRINDPREPLDIIKHEWFEDHIVHPPGLALGVQRQLFRHGATTGLYCHNDFYELYIVRAGRGTSVINGHSYKLVRGDIYIVPPGGSHGLYDYEGIEADVFYFQTQLFTRDELAALRQMRGFWKLLLHDGYSRHEPKHERRLRLSPDRQREAEQLIERVRTEICEPPPLGTVLAHHYFFLLLTQLARWHGDMRGNAVPEPAPAAIASLEKAGVHAERLAEVLQYCQENLDQPITVPQMAARMFVSPDHFTRLFANAIGVPPAAYLRSLRLAHAQTLLRDTALPVAEIARLSGLRDPDQLAHAFRKEFSTTPTKYRALFHK